MVLCSAMISTVANTVAFGAGLLVVRPSVVRCSIQLSYGRQRAANLRRKIAQSNDQAEETAERSEPDWRLTPNTEFRNQERLSAFNIERWMLSVGRFLCAASGSDNHLK